MRQALVDWLWTRAWEPLCNWRARRAATRTLREFESKPVSIVIGILLEIQFLLAGVAEYAKRLQHWLEPLLRVGLQAGRGDLQHSSRTVRYGFAIAVITLCQYDGFQLRHRPVKNVVDQNITVLAKILNLLAGFAQPPVEFGFVYHALRAAAITQARTQNFRVRRKNKNAYRLRQCGAYLRRTLDGDVEQ